MKATRIEEKYKEVIDRLSSKLRKEKGNTKRIEGLNKSTEYVKLLVDYLRKNPDVLYAHFNISEDDDDKIMNIWDKIESLKILEKIDFNKAKIKTMNIPSNVVNESTVLTYDDIPVIIDLNKSLRPEANYHAPIQYHQQVNYQIPRLQHNKVHFAPSNTSKKSMQNKDNSIFKQDPIHYTHIPLSHTSLNLHPPNIHASIKGPNVIPQNQIHNSLFNPQINDSNSLYDTFVAHPNNMPNISMSPNYNNSIYMTYPPMFSHPINQAKPLYNTYPSMVHPYINRNNSLYTNYPYIYPNHKASNSMHQQVVTSPTKSIPNSIPRVLNVKPYKGPYVPPIKGVVYMGGKSNINSVLKESKVVFTKLLKSNKYIKYKKRLYVKYNNYLLYVPFLIAYISNKKISNPKKAVVKSKIKK